VLLIGDPAVAAYLRRGLEKRGCQCSFAETPEKVFDIIDRKKFDLLIIISPLERQHSLLSQLAGSRCSVICYQSNGPITCWSSVTSPGRTCVDVVPLCPAEFIEMMDRIADELSKTEATVASDSIQ